MLYLLIKGRKRERLYEAPVQLRHYLFQSSDLGSTFNFSIITSCVKKIPFYPLIPILGSKGSNMETNSIICLIFTWRALGSPVKSPSLQTKLIIRIMNYYFCSDQKLLGHGHHYYQNRHHHNICNESPLPPLHCIPKPFQSVLL